MVESNKTILTLGALIIAGVALFFIGSYVGNAFYSPKTTTAWKFSCVFLSETDGVLLNEKSPASLCSSLGNKMVPISLEKRFTYIYKDSNGKVLFVDRDTVSLNVAGAKGNAILYETESNGQDIGGSYKVSVNPSGILCCEPIPNK